MATTRQAADPLPFGLFLFLFGAGIAAVTLLSLSADDVSFARTQWTVRLSMALAALAITLFAARGAGGAWWRASWTLGLAAYLLHVWWAVFRSFGGDLDAIVARQGAIAATNALVTILWTFDVLDAWLLPQRLGERWRTRLRWAAWLSVTVSFVVAAAFFRAGLVAAMGFALALLVAGALALRLYRRRQAVPVSLSAQPVAVGGG